MIKGKILLTIILVCLVFISGCSEDISQKDPREFLSSFVEKLREVDSYSANMNVAQKFGESLVMNWDIIIYENIGEENTLYYLTKLDGEKMMEIYQIKDTFTISFNFGGFNHSETFSGEDFEQITDDILIMEIFEELTDFTNLVLTEDRNHYLFIGEFLRPTLINNELITFDNFSYELDKSRIEILISKRTGHIERVILETVLYVEEERVVTKAELLIFDINETNNIKEMIRNQVTS